MQLEAIKVFCDLVNLRSFSKAAEANELSQPTVTRFVHHLETRLGGQLIDRSKRPLQPTPLGKAYYEEKRDKLAATEFGPSYRRAALMQASLAAVGLIAALLAWVQGRRPAVLIGGLLLGAVIPFTLLVILPTNKRLLDPNLDRSSAEAAALLARWGRLHAVRSLLSALAFGVLVCHLAGQG